MDAEPIWQCLTGFPLATAVLAEALWAGYIEPIAITAAIMCFYSAQKRKTEEGTLIATAAGFAALVLANSLAPIYWLMMPATAGLIALCYTTYEWPKIRIHKWPAYWFYPGHLAVLLAIFN